MTVKRLDLSVGQRLMIGSLTVAILVAVLGIVLYRSVSRVSELRQAKLQVIAPRAAAARDLETAIFQQAIAFRNYAITRSSADLQAFRDSVNHLDERLDDLEAMPMSSEGRQLFNRILPLVAQHQASFEEFLAMSTEDRDVLRVQEVRISEHRHRVLSVVREFASRQAGKSVAADRSIDAAVDDLRTTVTVVILLILAASVMTSWLVSRSVRRPAARLVAAAEALGEGNFTPALTLRENRAPNGEPYRDELREAMHSFGVMAATLRLREDRLAAHSRLSGVLSTSLEPREVADLALRELTTHVGAEVGVVFLTGPDGQLQPVSDVGLDGELQPLSGGIPAQVAADRKTRIVRDIPADAPFRVRLGIDAVPPRTIVAAPMVVNDRVTGVIVLGSLRPLDDDSVAFVEDAAGQLGITLDNALAHVRIAALADELQEKNETLQGQNEELQAQGEELQAQNEELQAQSEELQTQADELQSQAEELRAQQAALARTNEALVAAETQKNHFLAVLGHELRNPLAAISGAESLLVQSDSGQGDEIRSRVHDVIRRQTGHLVRMVDDLLDIGRITSGKVELSRRPIDLASTVARCVSVIKEANNGARVIVETEEPIWIDGDETRIEQIVTNLLTNAQRYTPKEGIISVEVKRVDGDAVVQVRDTGVGIEPQLLPHVFDFFVQGTEGSKGGLGIGLSLVKRLAELHGGSVKAESEGRGRGATVTVRIPALSEAPVVVPHDPAASILPIRKSIVLVEDNPDLRQMMKLVLKRGGHVVAEASDGPAGVDAVRRVRPDVALIDLDLPGFDGCEVARQIRLDPALAGVRLIAVSGYGRPEDRERSLAAGFDEHLVKPVEMARLTNALLSLPDASF